MNCQCLHESVCSYASNIRQAVSQIIVLNIGGRNIAWNEIETFVKKRCQYYLPKPKKEDNKND
jgi:hypothetical protein